MAQAQSFGDLSEVVDHLRTELQQHRYILLYAYNGTGKTRLSREFNRLGKSFNEEGDVVAADTLYFNAFTGDLFSWDNDLDNDERRSLELNAKSRFFAGLGEFEIANRVQSLLNCFADFTIDVDMKYREPEEDDEKPMRDEGRVSFSREILVKEDDGSDRSETIEHIKVSRGEENIFIWCFFLAIVEVALDPDLDAYDWVKYIYIDDPISSLDEQNAVKVATHLAMILKQAHVSHSSGERTAAPPGVVISTHHPLFHNVLWNEFKEKHTRRYFLSRDLKTNDYLIRNTAATPFFHHIATLAELYERGSTGDLDTYHFNALRAVVEKTAIFLGYNSFGDCIKRNADDYEGVLHTRVLNLLSHGGYSLYEPKQMVEDNKDVFRAVLHTFIRDYAFSQQHFPKFPQSEPDDDQEVATT
ncbi:MAG: anticodon nuclease [Phycisphaerales bacterium]